MQRIWTIRGCLTVAALLCLALGASSLQARDAESVSFGDIVAMLESGVAESVILLQLERTGTVLDLSSGQIIRLHEAGASEDFLSELLSHPGEPDEAVELPPNGVSFLPSEPTEMEPSAMDPPAELSRTPLPAAGGNDGFRAAPPSAPDPVPTPTPVETRIIYRSLPLVVSGSSYPYVRTPYNRYPGTSVVVPHLAPSHSCAGSAGHPCRYCSSGVRGSVHLSGRRGGVSYGVSVGTGGTRPAHPRRTLPTPAPQDHK